MFYNLLDDYLYTFDGIKWNKISGGGGSATIDAQAPLNYSNGILSINKSSSLSDGYLSSTDWTTFNNKANSNHTHNALNIIFTPTTSIPKNNVQEAIEYLDSISVKKYSTQITYNHTSAYTFTIIHNLSTTTPNVTIFENFGNKERVFVGTKVLTNNSVQITFPNTTAYPVDGNVFLISIN